MGRLSMLMAIVLASVAAHAAAPEVVDKRLPATYAAMWQRFMRGHELYEEREFGPAVKELNAALAYCELFRKRFPKDILLPNIDIAARKLHETVAEIDKVMATKGLVRFGSRYVPPDGGAIAVAVKQNPNDLPVRCTLAQFYLSRGKPAQAAELAAGSLHLVRTTPVKPKALEPLCALLAAIKALPGGTPKAVAAELAAIKKAAEAGQFAFYPAQRVCAAAGMSVDEVAALSARLERAPGHVPTALALAKLHVKAKHVDKAIQVLKQTAKHTKPDHRIYMMLGQCFQAIGNKAEAKAAYERALAHCTSNPKANAIKKALAQLGK